MSPARRSGPGEPEGMQAFLDYWLYGVVKTAAELGNARVFLRSVQEDSIRKLFEREGLSFGADRDPMEMLRIYDRHLETMGILQVSDMTYGRDGAGLRMTVGTSCPYRSTCNWIHEEGTVPPCFRAVALSEVLRLGANLHFDAKLACFDVPCQITFKPIPTEVTDDGA